MSAKKDKYQIQVNLEEIIHAAIYKNNQLTSLFTPGIPYNKNNLFNIIISLKSVSLNSRSSITITSNFGSELFFYLQLLEGIQNINTSHATNNKLNNIMNNKIMFLINTAIGAKIVFILYILLLLIYFNIFFSSFHLDLLLYCLMCRNS